LVLLISFIILYHLTNKNYTDLPLLVIFIIGFYLPNIYLFYNRYKKLKAIEKDLLNTITLINNAYKAGKSTLQAIEMVSKQSSDDTAHEFSVLYQDLVMGLSIEEAFKGLAKRLPIEEIDYIATTISISEKTGGNIIKVFSSIEKTLYNREKVTHEMKTLTANSKITIKVLIFMPIFFSFIIYILSPDYFNPLFNTNIGNIILLIIGLMFTLYIFFVTKILKVRV
jgi:tight adherence protein B